MNLADSVSVGTSQAMICSDHATELASGHAERVCGALRPNFSLSHPPTFEFEGYHYQIGVANTRGQLNEVHSLLHRMYSWRGYMTSVEEEARAITERITLKASIGEHVMGTLSVELDCANGLPADELYRDESNVFRRPGNRLCEFTRLAVDIGPRVDSKDFLARLIHVAFVYAHLTQHATDMLIEVNPRHVAFYRRCLGFTQVGPERICSRVDAPAVLMHIDLHHMATQIRVHGGGHRHGSERTLYPHFLSVDGQLEVGRRIWHYLHHLKSAATPSLSDISSKNAIERLQAAEAQGPLAA